jgi:transposase
MSMYPQALGPIPEETVRVARAACPKGTLAMRLRDVLGAVYQDEQFAKLYPVEGQPAYAPWRLAVVTVLQYAENLSDRQAANAVRERIDWKYSLGLELSDPGFDFSLLSEFRTRLVEQEAETLLLERLLEVCKERQWLKAGGKQRTDSTHVLARVRSLSNLECVGETLRATLDDLAQLAPQWLSQQVSPDWFERYSHRVENYRLPKAESQRTALAQQIGADGLHLLQALEGAEAPAGLKDHASVQVLRQVWQQYYEVSAGQARWRDGPQASAGEGIIRSPYDPEAQSGKKRDTVWLGYKVHLTETCALEEAADEAQRPHLIVQVHTTVAPVQDVEVTACIQEGLAQQNLLPEDQFVDTGYVDADLLVSSQQDYGIRLVGPTLADNSWQARASMRRTFNWIGKPRSRSARRGSRAAAGVWPVSASRWCLPRRCVPLVRCAASVHSPRPRAGCCMYVRKRLMRPCKHDARKSRRPRFGRSIPLAQASRGRSRRGYAAWVCVGRSTMGSPRRSCSTS